MPYLQTTKICTRCQETNKLFRYRWHGQNQKHCFVSICKDCEKTQTYKWRKENPEAWSKLLSKSYKKQSEGKVCRRNNMEHTPETRAQWARDKSNRRCGRAKQARFVDELTELVTIEAHDLRKRRNQLTGIEWHVDHIVPLRGKEICGFHIWSNLQVIPKILNLRKGVHYPLHEKWPA